MKNPLIGLVKKVSKMEELGIYIENIDLSDRYKLMDDNPMTLTGTNRPAGEYYQAHLLVLVSVEQPEDDGDTLVKPKLSPTIQGIYAPVQDAIPACKHKRFKRLNVATPKTETKYPDDIDKVVSAKPKHRKRKAK